jgi:aryl-alcohol dehydrogenase-like predicted oxidoreductase
MGRIGRRESLRILETAYDAGVTHFDVARSYGFGEAEEVLGDLLSTKRDKVTVTTKFGILPPRRSTGLDVAKAVARKLVTLNPRTRRVLRQRAAKLVTGGHFSVQDAKSSLKRSLQELRTDYVDILLLHDCSAEDLESDDLLEFLEVCVKEGKIRYFGTATDLNSTQQILQFHKSFTPIVQLANSVLNRNIDYLPPHPSSAVITHSALGTGLKRLHKYVLSSARRTSKWSNAVGKDCSKLSVISGLMLNYAVRANPPGVVLFSSQNERNILLNTASVSDSVFSGDQIERFLDLVTQDLELVQCMKLDT